MNELDQFLNDFYSKYAPGTLTPDKIETIKQTYGEDYDGLITDLYSKYAKDKLPDSARLAQIKEVYGFQPAAEAPVAEPEEEQEGGFIGAIKSMVEAAQTPADPDAPKPVDPFVNAVKRGGNLAEQSRIITPDGAAPSEEGLARVAELQAAQETLPASQAYQKFNSSKTFGEALTALAESPALIITEITAESMSGLVQGGWDKVATRAAQGGATGAVAGSAIPGIGTAAGMTGGMASGAVVGMGETSLSLEYAGSILESLQEAGVDTQSKESLAKAFADDNIISEARKHALKKGVPIAIFDLISGGVAGRIVNKPAKSLLGKLGQGAMELGVQAGLGAAGETAGQVVAGEELNPAAILSEAIGELGTAPVEVAIGATTYNRERGLDPAIADAEKVVDEETSGFINEEAQIDAEYKNLAAKFDELDIDVRSAEEDIASDIEAFSVTAEESELPPDAEFTSQEAARLQARGPLPSQAEQEQRLAEDDSEATPALDKQVDAMTPSINEESELPMDAQFTPEEAARIQAARVRESFPSDEEALEQTSYQKKQSQRAKRLEEQLAAKQEVVERKEEIKQEAAPIEKAPRVRTKPPVDPEQQKQDRLIKYEKQLGNILKDKPNKQKKRLEILNENTLDLPEVNEKVKARLEQLKAVTDEKEFKKQIKTLVPNDKVKLIRDRVGEAQEQFDFFAEANFVLPTEENWAKVEDAYEVISNTNITSAERAEIDKIYKDTKAIYDKALAESREAKAKQEKEQAKARMSKENQKDNFLKNIALSVEVNNPVSIEESVKAYKEWRKKEGLKELDTDAILKHAKAPYYADFAKARAKAEARERAAKEQKARREQQQAEQKKKADDSTKQLKKDLGLPDDTDAKLLEYDEDVEVPESTPGQFPSDYNGTVFSNPKPTTLSELFNRIDKVYPKGPFLSSLKNLIALADKVSRKKYRNGLEVFTADPGPRGGAGGVFLHNDTRQIIVINNFSPASTIPHELIHSIVKGIVLSIKERKATGSELKAEIEFYNRAEEIYKGALASYRDNLIRIQRKFRNGTELNSQDVNFLTAISSYLSARHRSDLHPTNPEAIQVLLDDSYDAMGRTAVYGLYNSDEMIAETFANPNFMMVMGLLEADKPSPTSKGKSYFAQIIDALTNWIKQVAAKAGVNYTPIANSYLKHLTDYMSSMEQQFLHDDAPTMDQVPVDDIVLDKVYRAEGFQAQEFSALYNLTGGTQLTPELKKFLNSISTKWWKRNNLQSVDAVMRQLERINLHTTKNKFNLGHAQFVWMKIQKYRQQLADAKEIQETAADFIRTREIYDENGNPVPNEYTTSKIFKKTVDDFAAVDLDAIDSPNRIQQFQQGIIDLAMGIVPDQKAYNVVTRDVAAKKLKALLPMAGKYSKNPGLYLPKKLSIKYLANPATYASILARYNKDAAQTLFNQIYAGMLEARTHTQLEAGAFTQKLFELYKKHNMTNSDFVRAGMYGAIFTTQLPPTHPEYWTEIRENAQTVLENAQNKLQALKDELTDEKASIVDKELEIARELHSTVARATSMDGILTRKQQLLYDEFRNFAKKYENDIKRNTEGVWGNVTKKKIVTKNGKIKVLKQPPVWQHNYFPTFAIGRSDIGTHPDKDPGNLIPGFDESSNLWEALQKPNQYGKVISHQAGFTKKKVKPKGYFYDYNLLSIAHKFAPAVLFDLYATRELKALNQLLHGVQTKAGTTALTVDGKALRNVMSVKAAQGLSLQLKNIVGNTVISDAEINSFMKGFMKARNTVATAMIATSGQFLVQTSSAYPAALIMSPTGFPKALKTMALGERDMGQYKNLKDFIEREGMSIQLRDVLFERFLTIEDAQKSGIAKGFSRLREQIDAFNTYAIRKADKHAARLVWLSEYFAQGGTLENPNKKAILAAERAVGLLQNMSDVAFSAPIFRSNSSAVRILVHMFYAFQSFALNAGLNTIYSAKYSLLTNNIEARKVFLASLVMAGAYQIVTEYLISPFYSSVSSAIFGDDDDDEEEVNYSRAQKVAAATAYDVILGNVAPELIDNATKLAMVTYLEHRAKQEGDNFDRYKDFPLWAPATVNDILAKGMGQYGTLATSAIELGSAGITAVNALAEGEEMTDEQMLFLGMQNFAMLSRYFPLRGDVQKLLRKYESRLKQKERLAKKASGGGDPESVGTEFEFTEYEFNVPSDPTDLPEFEFE